jgi:predicted nucleotidyltransferase
MTISELCQSAIASQIAEVCRRYHVQELALFGSVARAEETAESDIDVYVEFEPGCHPGLHWFDLEEDLERILGRPVDLSRKSLLKPRVRREAERDAVVLYAA